MVLVLMTVRNSLFYDHYIICLLLDKIYIIDSEVIQGILYLKKTNNFKDVITYNTYTYNIIEILLPNNKNYIKSLKRFLKYWDKDKINYNLFHNNCENLSRYIFYGNKISKQVKFSQKLLKDMLKNLDQEINIFNIINPGILYIINSYAYNFKTID